MAFEGLISRRLGETIRMRHSPYRQRLRPVAILGRVPALVLPGRARVGPSDRLVRAAAVAVVTAAIGLGGVSSVALAAEPTAVTVSGTLVDEHGAALAGVHLVIEELLAPDGGLAGFQVVTDAKGAFSADVEPWGTADEPATLTVSTPPDVLETVNVIDGSCTRSFSVIVKATRDVALADGPADPLALMATTELLGEVCGTTATPPPTSARTPKPGLTPPPTDAAARSGTESSDRLGLAAALGFAAGLAGAVLYLTPRPRGRRRS
jgi:hypothetical protein